MAERPIFVSLPDSGELVQEIFFQMRWHSGFARVQKEKNIDELHAAAAMDGYRNLLEISTKSKSERGRHLSAFHITAETKRYGTIKLELAFQGSKVFERGGPFTDLYAKGESEVGTAKRDPRLQESGALVGFRFEGVDFPLEPKTAFYDWLYVSFLKNFKDWAPKLYAYGGSKAFTVRQIVTEIGIAGYAPVRSSRFASSQPAAIFVPEGFSKGAFLLPVLWALWHRMWLAAIFIPIGGMLLAALLIALYPLTHARMTEIRAELDARKAGG